MKISSTSIVAFSAALQLLLMHLVGASISCPSDYNSRPPTFDQSCQNACSTGADAGAIVGPGMLTSGEAPAYQVAGGCVGMISTMANAYDGLSEEERERVFLLAVGKHDYRKKDQNFCQGFAACADDNDGSWWTTWDVAQRDVFFYIKMDPNDDDSWQYHCRYSMNTGRGEFENTIREMLTMTEAISETLNEADDELAEDYLAGNETSIEQG